MTSKPLKDRLNEFLDDDWFCPVCKDLPHEEPQQSNCGHRLCGPCVKYLKRNNNQPTCPGDNLSIEPLFVDHFYQREMQHKKCHCVFRVNGCQWNSIVKELKNHEEKCDFRDVTCPDCEATMMLANLQLHRENVCVNRLGSCEFCSQTMRVVQIEDHHSQCQEIAVECPHACGTTGIVRRCMNEHLTKNCLKAPQSCIFASKGCDFSGNRLEQEGHRKKELDFHMRLLSLEDDKTNETISFLVKENKDLREIVRRQDLEMTGISELVRDLQASLLEQQCQSSHASASEENVLASQIREVILSLQSQRECTERLQEELLLVKPDTSSLEEQLSRFCHIWKIDDFLGRRQHASQAFYTGQYGYKMRLSTELRREQCSTLVSLQVLRGKYDDLLNWPFVPRIDIILWNEERNQRSIQFHPSPADPFFTRPETDFNKPFTVVIDCRGGPSNRFLVKGPVYVYIGFEQQRIPKFLRYCFKGHDIKP